MPRAALACIVQILGVDVCIVNFQDRIQVIAPDEHRNAIGSNVIAAVLNILFQLS